MPTGQSRAIVFYRRLPATDPGHFSSGVITAGHDGTAPAGDHRSGAYKPIAGSIPQASQARLNPRCSLSRSARCSGTAGRTAQPSRGAEWRSADCLKIGQGAAGRRCSSGVGAPATLGVHARPRQAPFNPPVRRAANQETDGHRGPRVRAAPSGGRFPAADLPCERYSAFSSALISERNGLCDIGSLIDPSRMSAMATWRP